MTKGIFKEGVSGFTFIIAMCKENVKNKSSPQKTNLGKRKYERRLGNKVQK